MKMAAVLAVALAIVSVWAVMAGTAVWLAEAVRVFGLVMMPSAIAASLLVRYFDWRGRMIRGFRTEYDADEI